MTDTHERTVSRRSMMAATGLGAAVLAGLAHGAAAETLATSDAEKANVAIVEEFMALLALPGSTPEKLASYLTEDCVLRLMENQPAAEGRAAAIAIFKVLFEGGRRFGINTLHTLARGPIVANDRIDWVINPDGQRGEEFAIAGVFILRDGKIHEWADYVVKN